MDATKESRKLKDLLREVSMIHKSITGTLADVESTVRQLRDKSSTEQELQWKIANETLTVARANVASLLRRERASISSYAAFQGENMYICEFE